MGRHAEPWHTCDVWWCSAIGVVTVPLQGRTEHRCQMHAQSFIFDALPPGRRHSTGRAPYEYDPACSGSDDLLWAVLAPPQEQS